jgi:pimeloyl-ACP methyl ester carboxylesterase
MGYPVLLIHGMWCTGRNWDRIVAILTPRGYDCHAPTLPAHEPGPRQEQEVGAKSLKDYLNFLEDYVRSQNFSQPPIVIGHSMGGFLAQALSTRIKPLALVLLTPAAPAGIFALRLKNTLAFLAHFLRWGFWRKPFKISVANAERYAYNGLQPAQQQKLYDGLVYESGRAIFEVGMAWADFGRAAKIDPSLVQCPVYVVSCASDALVPAAVVKKVAALYPQSSMRQYLDRSHWVIDDDETEDMMVSICGWLRPFEQRAARGQSPPR